MYMYMFILALIHKVTDKRELTLMIAFVSRLKQLYIE